MVVFFVLMAFLSFGESSPRQGVFSGRISTVNEEAGLIQVKVDFSNLKYLQTRDKVEFWAPPGRKGKCNAIVKGRSPDYLLLRIPNYEDCHRNVPVVRGTYLMFFSENLVQNIQTGEELVDILLKKRLAIQSKMSRYQKGLETHDGQVKAVNERYELLLQKLHREWDEELAKLETNRVENLRNVKGLEIRLQEVDFKMQKYRVDDGNLRVDRWSLDPRLYFRK